MLQYYEEITLLPGEEISQAFLWTKVFTQIHIAFAAYQHTNGNMPFAVSFPEFKDDDPGRKLRVFGESREELEALNLPGYLHRLTDYIHLPSIRRLPSARIKGYAIYSRYQPDSSAERKARRYAKRHEGTSYEEALELFKLKKATPHMPYIQIKSLSTGEHFSLFIQKKEVNKENKGHFGSYGLSTDGTVPEF